MLHLLVITYYIHKHIFALLELRASTTSVYGAALRQYSNILLITHFEEIR